MSFDHLAPYASHLDASRGRLYEEEECSSRSTYRRDCDRIIHSSAFRRLEYKTQVFINHEGDHFRTRLTHSLEVAQIARSLARSLCLDEDLAEALALAHDLGHTPFGHAGEDALSEAKEAHGGFDHNVQTFKLVTQLEHRYAQFDGLNLTWETLEGLIKHNGPLIGRYRDKTRYNGDVHPYILNYHHKFDLKLDSFPSLEAQVAGIADDIAYNNHDLDDGMRAKLFTLDDLKGLSLLAPIIVKVRSHYSNLSASRQIHEVIRRLINTMITDLTENTQANIVDLAVKTPDDIRDAKQMIACFSDKVEEGHKELKCFLREHMYRHYHVCRMTSKAKRLLKEMYALLMDEPDCLPDEWNIRAQSVKSNDELAEIVADFIAGMTDRFAMEEHARLFDLNVKA